MNTSPGRPLPPPIKPRALKRSHYDTYVTTDGRYRFDPQYRGMALIGYTAEDLHNPGRYRGIGGVHPLRYWRELLCSPSGKVPWVVCDVDDGVLRVEPTRAAAVEWARSFADAAGVKERHQYGEGRYEYVFADSDGDICGGVNIVRADVAHASGIDPLQQPLYPFPDEPFERVERGGGA